MLFLNVRVILVVFFVVIILPTHFLFGMVETETLFLPFLLCSGNWQWHQRIFYSFSTLFNFSIDKLIPKKKKKSNCGSKFFSKWSVRNLEKSLTDGQQRRGVENYTKSNKKKISCIDKKDVSTKEFTISFFEFSYFEIIVY